MSTIEGRNFDGTCEQIDLQHCKNGGTYMDPCSCKSFYTCVREYELIKEHCSDSTLFDYKNNNCDHENSVKYQQNCTEGENAWLRCNTTQTRIAELQALCTNSTIITTSTPMTAPPPTTKQPTSDGINAGMVVGLIIAGAVAAIVAAALIILFIRNRKKSKLKKENKKRGTVAHNPEYFEGGVAEDPYAIIDDTMTDPTYHGDTLPQSNGTMSTVMTTLPEPEDDIVYDNSIPHPASLPENSDGYTDTINRETTQDAYSRLATINENESNNSANILSAEKPADNVTINRVESSNSYMEPLSTLDSLSSANTGSGKSNMEAEQNIDKEKDENEQNEQRQLVVDYYTLEKKVDT